LTYACAVMAVGLCQVGALCAIVAQLYIRYVASEIVGQFNLLLYNVLMCVARHMHVIDSK